MDIAVNSKSSQAKLGKLHLRTRAQLGAVELLEIDNLGRFYVMVEVVPSGQGAGAQTFIARFAQNSTFEGTYELPLKPDVALARRFVTVSPDGDVYFLRTRKGTVDVLGVGFAPMAKTKSIDQRRPGKQPADQPVLTQPSTKATDAAPRLNVGRTAIAAVGPLNRQRVVETAFAFESIKWPVTSATYGNDPDRQCSGFDRIRRPGYLRGQLNHEARGVPYCWGCSGSLAQFASRIERGSLAGNVCTRDEPRRDVAGVDCSSFVSAAWGLSTHFTTSAIPSIAAPIDDPWSMKPGDAFNKPNSHVMLFLGYTADRKAQVMEASPGACNGRVCRNVYPIASLLARGYTPRRFRGLEGDMSSAHIALADAPPGPTVGGMSRPSGKSKTTVGRPGNSHVAASAPEAAGPVAGKQKGRANAAAEPKAAPGESWSNKIFADRR